MSELFITQLKFIHSTVPTDVVEMSPQGDKIACSLGEIIPPLGDAISGKKRGENFHSVRWGFFLPQNGCVNELIVNCFELVPNFGPYIISNLSYSLTYYWLLRC